MVQFIVIEDDFAGQRIDNFLLNRLKGVPRTRIYSMLRKGEVRINKKRIKPSYRLEAGDSMRVPPVTLDERPIPAIPSRQKVALLEQRILYEDESVLVINKPAGIPVHGGTGISMGVIETLRVMYPNLRHLELAHRLDLDTSGCLVLAKKRSALREIHDLLRTGQVRKIYWTLTKGHWKASELKVDVALHKNHLSSGERIVRVDKAGKESLTLFRVLEEFEHASLVEATLKTGRTHQIRVHAQHRGHCVAGDEKYGDREFNKFMRQCGLRRLFLHARFLEFKLPSSGLHLKIEAPLDTELAGCLENLKAIESRSHE